MKQEMTGWQLHQVDDLQIICTLLQTDNHSSTSSLNISTGRMLFLTPYQQCLSSEGNTYEGNTYDIYNIENMFLVTSKMYSTIL